MDEIDINKMVNELNDKFSQVYSLMPFVKLLHNEKISQECKVLSNVYAILMQSIQLGNKRRMITYAVYLDYMLENILQQKQNIADRINKYMLS